MTQWILTSSVLILLVLAVRGLFKNKMKAKAVYALWLIVLVRLLCPVNFGALSFNLLSLAEEGKAQVEERLELQQAEEQQELQQDIVVSEGVFTLPENAIVYYPPKMEAQKQMHAKAPVIAPEIKTEVSAAAPELRKETSAVEVSGFSFPEISWQKVLPYAWIIGMVCMMVVIFGVNISFSTTLGMFRKELPLLKRMGRGRKKLSVYLADGIVSSCLYGLVHPSIYLNKQGMNDREKTYCVEHEYSHYLQGDMVWSLCRILCLVLHWYNPLVWVAVMLSKKDAELACDERTIERLGEEERYSYGHTLVELAAKQSTAVQMFGMATLMASDKKEVVERVKAITTKKQTKLITGLLVAALVIGIGFFVFTGEAKGEQDNNTNEVAQVTEAPAPPVVATENTSEEPTTVEEKKQDTKQTVSKATAPIPMSQQAVPKGELTSTTKFLEYVLEEKCFPIEAYVVQHGFIKDEPWYHGENIGLIGEGEKITVLGVEKDYSEKYWFEISFTKMYSYGESIGYVRSECLTLTDSFRIYEERDINSVFTEHLFYPNYIRCMRDAGDKCWFFVGTAEDEFGWVLYGEHEGMDSRILDMLGISEKEFKENREKMALRVELATKNSITYQPLVFTDHVSLKLKNGEGWLIDLNGDGIEEQLYIDEDSVFIDGKIQLLYRIESKHSFWLLDIDTTDGILELLDDSGSMYIYNGKELREVKGIQEVRFYNVQWYNEKGELVPITEEDVKRNTKDFFLDSNGEIYARYLPKLNEFTRIDEHTISFESYFCIGQSFMASPQYVLDENHKLQMVSLEYDVTPLDYFEGTAEFDIKDESGKAVKVYEARDLSGDYIERQSLSKVSMLKSDCVEWGYIETPDGTKGWIYFGEGSEYDISICKNEE